MGQSPVAATTLHFLAQLEAGVAGSDDGSPTPYPYSELPPWLVQVLAVLFEGQDVAVARKWARRVDRELDRLDGRAPFRVVHDWHARIVAPLLAESSAWHGGDAGLQQTMSGLHIRALAGESVGEAEWIAGLEPALREVYHRAYPYADAYATASANAMVYAVANGFSAKEAVAYAHAYAKLSADSTTRSCAEANAIANARAAAVAFVSADADAYAEAYPFASVRAYVEAIVGRDDVADPDGHRRATYGRLADGLVECLSRVDA